MTQPNKNGRIYPHHLFNNLRSFDFKTNFLLTEEYNKMSEEEKMDLINNKHQYVKTDGEKDITYMKINDYMYHYDRLFFDKYKLLFDDYNPEFKEYGMIPQIPITQTGRPLLKFSFKQVNI